MQLRDATIAVTGATGFLGRYLVRALQGRGARVVGVVRNPGKVPELSSAGVELRRADLAEPDALARGFAGADAVVSNAALLPVRNWSRHALSATNVQGTEHVLAAAAGAGVRRVVHVSSVSVYQSAGRGPVTEDQPLLERVGFLAHGYGLSKAVAETRAWRLAETHRLALTTLRPCLIYGAFDSNFMPILALYLRLPVAVLPVGTWLPTVYAGDVAEAAVLALEKPAAEGRAYNLAGSEATLAEFIHAWRAAGGRTPPLRIPLPLPFRRAFDTTRAERELGWEPRPMVEGLRESFALEAAARR